MELEEMKTLWGEMSAEMEKQKKLTDSLIIKMTQVNYNHKVAKIWVPEAIGSAGCFVIAAYILINMGALNTWYLLVCGIVSALLLILMPTLTIRSIFKIRSINISANSYKESLIAYSSSKKQIVSVQKLKFYLGAILMLVSLPVMSELIGGKDIFKITGVWYWYLIISPIYYWFATRWVSRCYLNVLAGAENILKEIEA
ncbi:hypothetical protein [Mucilaginibacter gotjawali]|uniref:Uncharacterized protein n=1 Tax=Mucilaginibacter gotjawali TaxID=1550579 RepID=A0A839SC18_9SPHI|nr:hypothetical protein [Mucilaginibacter gotjawali]MBB3054864.1 hypothetical protein [Mucilaginibacter gotjawali]